MHLSAGSMGDKTDFIIIPVCTVCLIFLLHSSQIFLLLFMAGSAYIYLSLAVSSPTQLPTFQYFGCTSSLWHLGSLLYVFLCQEGSFTLLSCLYHSCSGGLRPSFSSSRKSFFPLLLQHSCMVRELPWESPASRASLWLIIYPSVLLPLLSKLSPS